MTDFRKAQAIRLEGGEEKVDSLDSSKEARQYLGFVFGAIRRRKLRAATVLVLVIGATVGLLRILPKSYHVETKILAQRQQTLPAIARPNVGEEAPTQAAWEVIHRRDNLVSLVERTHLMDKWQPAQVPALSPDDKLNALVDLVDEKLSVVTGEGTVTISIDWTDGQMAYQLVDTALQSFLEARRVSEISTIDEAIALLEGRAETLRSELEAAETEYRKQELASLGSLAGRRSNSRALRLEDQGLSQLMAMLEAKRRARGDAEEFRRRRLEELQAQLAERLAVYGEAYPSVVNLRQEISLLSREPPRLAALRSEEVELESTIARRGSSKAATVEPEERAKDVNKPKRMPLAYSLDALDEAEVRLRHARIKYETVLERIEIARIDLDTARTAFKYRYSVIWPPKVPGAPNKPNVQSVLSLGAIAALILAALSATIADIRAGRFVEPWQVEKALDLPILAEVRKS